MDEQRRETEVNMLQALLDNPGDSGTDLILSADSKSIDSDLVQTLYLEVPALTPESLVRAAKFFQRVIAPLEAVRGSAKLPATPQAYLTFLAEVLQAAAASSDPQRLYPLLRANADKLDQNFAQLLRRWATAVLPGADRTQARQIAAQIGNLSNTIGRFPLGSRANNLEIEIAGYEAVAKVFTRTDFPEQWATLQNNLGNAYSERPKGDRAQNLEQAIACFENALKVRTPQQYPEQWATLQNNLGSAYSDRLRGDPAENLEKAVVCYQNALRVRTREASGGEWASTQNNLGRAYSHRLRGDRAQNLELAVACYRNALQVYNRKSSPRRWATTQNNLANAYCDRLRGNRAENLEYAVNCYQRALQIRTREAFPLQWATTQSNLGRVFIDRVKGDPVENVENAIACYQNALQVYTRIKFPERWASIQTYLARAYNLRVKGEKADNLEMTVVCYQNALLFCNRQKSPDRWAMLCAYLGRAFSEHLKGEKNRNLKSAIACYQNALQVYTKRSHAERWAMLLTDLGRAFYDLTEIENSSNLESAIACYQSACQVYTRETYPHRWAQTLFYLGQAHRVQGELLRAYNVFAAAVDTVEFLRSEAGVDSLSMGDRSSTAKLKLAQTWTELYKSLVQVCLELGTAQPQYYAKALEYAERYKARNLVEMLVKCHLTPKAEIPATVRGELESLQLEIAAEQQHQEQGASDVGTTLISGGDSQDLNSSGFGLPNSDFTHLNQLWQQLDALIASEVEAVDPFFSLVRKVEPIEFKQIQELLPDESSAAISWASLGEVLVAFAVIPGAEYPAVHLCSPENALALSDWAAEYFSAYSEQKGRWINQLPARLHRLAGLLEIDKVVALIPQKCDRLVIVPHRFLHALPLHALPLGAGDGLEEVGGSFRAQWGDRTAGDLDAIGGSDFSQGWSFGEIQLPGGYLLDRFPAGIRYAPNSQLLRLKQIARSGAIGRYRPRLQQLLAVRASSRDSLYSNIEVGNICQFFLTAEVLAHKLATKQAVSSAIAASNSEDIPKQTGQLQQKKCTHFAVSSLLNLAQPLKSGVFLKDEFLSLEEVLNLDFRQHFLVTLSACETAAGGVSNAGDFVSLSAGLLYAGASSVVSSLWKASDVSTLLLTGKFYANLGQMPRLQVGDVAIALNEAQRWLRDLTGEELDVLLADFQPQISQIFDRLSPSSRLIAEASLQQIRNRRPYPFANPYYWAAFTAAGV
jgi:tetratricopeptide (TPR) repeat protein